MNPSRFASVRKSVGAADMRIGPFGQGAAQSFCDCWDAYEIGVFVREGLNPGKSAVSSLIMPDTGSSGSLKAIGGPVRPSNGFALDVKLFGSATGG
jgi:hypothetical protein